jgi:hypothetical protein
LIRRRTWRVSCGVARASSGCASAVIALSRRCSRGSEGKTPVSRQQALCCASSIAAVTITASSRAAAVQARSRAGLDRASARHRSNVATDTPISWDTRDISALSGGSSRATARSLISLPYRATVVPQCPQDYRAIEATTTLTQRAPAQPSVRPGSIDRDPSGSKPAWRPRSAGTAGGSHPNG